MNLKPHLLILPVLTLAACGGNNNSIGSSGVTNAAVVATAAPDYSSGAVSLVDTQAPYTAQNNLDATTSDISVRADGDHFFLIKRYGTDQIQRYSAAAPTTPVYTYSTNDSSGTDSNPYDLIVLNETKGYLLRYGSGQLWIVNPSATTEADFKTGEIDLSQYDADGVPQMSAGLIFNGKLYVAMQRLDTNYAATQNGYVAVIDTTTDMEVTTGSSDAALKGIELPVRDPIRMVTVPSQTPIVGTVFWLVADGGYDGSEPSNVQYDGGIVAIDTSNYSATLAIDDGDSTNHPYGTFADMAIAAPNRGYFIGSTMGASGTQSLYRFDPSMSSPDPVPVSAFQSLDLGSISVDASGNLWLGQTNTSAPGLTVLGFQNGTETIEAPLINTNLNPMNIDFVTAAAL